jgi:RHS repeat-associated protein
VTQAIYTLSPGVYGDLISQRRSGVSRYFVFDPLGSASRLIDGSQNATDSYLFKAFGEIILGGATTNPFRFVGSLGYYLDPDLTQYAVRARDLRAAFGRWLSADPLGFATGDANLFRYARNRPTFPLTHRG